MVRLDGSVADTPVLRLVTDLDGLNLHREELREQHLLGRFGRPSEIAAAAAFLASEDASFITGPTRTARGSARASVRVAAGIPARASTIADRSVPDRRTRPHHP